MCLRYIVIYYSSIFHHALFVSFLLAAAKPTCSVVAGTTLVWQVPMAGIGDVTEYRISVTGMSGNSNLVKMNASTFFFVPSGDHFIGSENRSIMLQVGERNSALP